jgi:hypothetical protein
MENRLKPVGSAGQRVLTRFVWQAPVSTGAGSGGRTAAVTGKIDVRGWQPPVANADGAYGSANGSG